MKNIMSKILFDVSYDALPLASEIIVDLKLSQMKYRILTAFLFSLLVATVIGICNIVW